MNIIFIYALYWKYIKHFFISYINNINIIDKWFIIYKRIKKIKIISQYNLKNNKKIIWIINYN